MRRLILLILALFALPIFAVAQETEELDSAEIAEVAESVVMIVALQGNQGVGIGSGTIMEPSGVIYTNRHVIEVGRDYAIYMLDDLGDPPELRYYASLVGASDAIDFALLQIDRDADGNSIDPATLNLNTVPLADQSMEVGEDLRIFGFPGLSEGLLTVTSGEIVTVQNGSLYGDRLPMWYWTDAEISSGNSGGLAINTEGEFIGIPTWVRAEARTAGRFAGVLPYQTIVAELGTAPSEQVIPGGDEPTTGTVELVIENQDEVPVCYVYISQTSAETWGEDQLGDQEIIDPGASRSFNVSSDYYDVLLQDCDQEALNDVRNIDLTQGVLLTHVDTFQSDLTRIAEDSNGVLPSQSVGEVTVSLENQGAATICYVYISPTSAMQWGEDRLGPQQVIEPGETAIFNFEPGIYDVQLLDCDRQVIDEAFELDLTQDTELIQER